MNKKNEWLRMEVVKALLRNQSIYPSINRSNRRRVKKECLRMKVEKPLLKHQSIYPTMNGALHCK